MQLDMGGGVDDDGARIPVRDQNGKFIGSRPPTAAERKDVRLLFKYKQRSPLRDEILL